MSIKTVTIRIELPTNHGTAHFVENVMQAIPTREELESWNIASIPAVLPIKFKRSQPRTGWRYGYTTYTEFDD